MFMSCELSADEYVSDLANSAKFSHKLVFPSPIPFTDDLLFHTSTNFSMNKKKSLIFTINWEICDSTTQTHFMIFLIKLHMTFPPQQQGPMTSQENL